MKTKFTFASSVLYASVSGLRTDARSVWSAKIVGIATSCGFNFSNSSASSVSVYGDQTGTITREWYYPNYPNSKGTMGIYFAVPKSGSNKSRYLEIDQDAAPGTPNILEGGKFATVALESGKTYLTHQSCSDGVYTEGSYTGQGVFFPRTGVWWAPVNCGYSSSSTGGMLYQWGRRFPFSSTTTPSYLTSQASSIAEGNNESKRGYFYKMSTTWHSDSDDNNWLRAYDPCPAGWRVPTLDNFGELFYSTWDRSTMVGSLIGSYSSSSWVFSSPSFSLSVPGTYRSCTGGTSSNGEYWTSTRSSNAAAYTISFAWNSKDYQYKNSLLDTWNQSYGFYVRCVQD